jgi:hypothetical protein
MQDEHKRGKRRWYLLTIRWGSPRGMVRSQLVPSLPVPPSTGARATSGAPSAGCTTAVASPRKISLSGLRRTPAPAAFQQHQAQLVFDAAKLLTQHRLKDEQPFRGVPDVELGGNVTE